MWIFSRNLMVGLAVLLLAYGCGSGSDSRAAAKAQAARAAAKRHVKPGDTLVSAVAATKTTVTLPVQVKFNLHARPDVGQPVDVDLVILPTSAAIDRLSGKITADEGLEVVDGGQIPASDRPAEGVEIHHVFRVLPKRDGIFTFSAALTVDSGVQSKTQTYSMPLIAGSGIPAAPAKPPGTTVTTDAATAVTAPAGASTAAASLPPTAAATTAPASTPATAATPR